MVTSNPSRHDQELQMLRATIAALNMNLSIFELIFSKSRQTPRAAILECDSDTLQNWPRSGGRSSGRKP